MDKRFWSGAVAVVTVVIAGAGVLPSLLLRPAVDDDPMAGSVEPAPFMSKPVKLVDYEPSRPVAAGTSAIPQVVAKPPEPKPETRAETRPEKPAAAATVAPAPAVQVAATHAVAPVVSQTKPAHEVSSAAVAGAPILLTAAVSASALPAPAQAAPAAFPPIQPVGVATQSGLDAKAKANVSGRPREAAAKPVRERVARQAASRERARPRRHGRPAPFPIRQFLAALRR
jgi:hypothetical protein